MRNVRYMIELGVVRSLLEELHPYNSQLNQIPCNSSDKLLTTPNSIRYLTFLLTNFLQLSTEVCWENVRYLIELGVVRSLLEELHGI